MRALLRYLIKPLKRWSYARGVHWTHTFSRAYFHKYVLKWLSKWRKCLAGDVGRFEQLDFPAEPAAILRVLEAALTFNDKLAPEERPLTASIATALASEKSESQRETIMASHLAAYAIGLKMAIAANIGLSHSKVREYWFNRGPRMLATMLFFCGFTIAVQELMHAAQVAEHGTSATSSRSIYDRLYTVIIASVAFLISSFMLYFRLPDSIEASIARSAHDYYRSQKTRIHAMQEALIPAGAAARISIEVQS